MKVIKRNGKSEEVRFDLITDRIKTLLQPDLNIDPIPIAQKVTSRLRDEMTTRELDDLSSQICMNLSEKNPEYGVLAARIAIDNHQKNTKYTFLQVVEKLYNNINITGIHSPLVSKELYDIVQEHSKVLEQTIDYSRDFLFDYFGFCTLLKAYLLKVKDEVIERPQHLWMRVAIGLHSDNIPKVIETYENMSRLLFTHATPTLFHAGTPRPQLASCFLLGTEDSVHGIYKTITDCAKISKWAGGIGCHISNIRAQNSYISSTGGKAGGILPMLKVYNYTAKYINQSGRRPGSFAMYLEPWHSDIFQFLDAKKNHGNEEEKARDLFYALWIPDAFMRAVEKNDDWYLMCPDQCPGLTNAYGKDFDELYFRYVREGKYLKKVKARDDIWNSIISTQIESGLPYMLYKDACNQKSNQKNLGTIKSSNLCTEILEYSDHKEYAVCNLSSISLSKFVKYPENPFQKEVKIYTKENCNWCLLLKGLLRERNIPFTEVELKGDEISTFFQEISRNTLPQLFDGDVLIGGYDSTFERLKPTYDFEELGKVTKIVTRNLNRTIDIGFYPVVETQRSNLRHRPIGIGVQGLADAFIQMRYPFDSEQARELNSQIFETIYYYSISESLQLSKEREGNMILLREMLIDEKVEIPELYSRNFKHSNNEIQTLYHDLRPILNEIKREKYYGSYSTFENSPLHAGKFQFDLWDDFTPGKYLPLKYDWDELRKEIMKYGTRNSLLLAPMPTASTSQILGNNECIEPYTSNMYTRRTMAGEFTIINKWLIRDLINIGIWNDEMSEKLMFYRGSVQKIREIPELFKKMYKTAWELKQRVLIDQSVDRGRFVDQSQSLNLFFAKPDFNVLSKCHFYSWKKGLKTGSYYIRSKPAMNAQSFTIDPKKAREFLRQEQEAEREKYGECLTCSS